MDQLIELLQQIQDLAGVAIDALGKAAQGGRGGESQGGGGGQAPAPEAAPSGGNRQ